MDGLRLGEEVRVFLAGGLGGGQPLAGGGGGCGGIIDADYHAVAFVKYACSGERDLERSPKHGMGGTEFIGSFHAINFGFVHAEAGARVEDGPAGGGTWLQDDHGMLGPAVQYVLPEVHVPLQFEVLGLDCLVVAQGVFVLLIRSPTGVDSGGRGGGGRGV